MLSCPNCSSPVDSEPVRCGRCGYRAEMAREYFWIYGGGALLVLVGFSAGAAGVILEVGGPSSWSRRLEGWFPLEPWPTGYQWLAFLVVGIVLSVAGLGITRRRAVAWGFAAVLLLYEAAWTILALVGLQGGDGSRGAAGTLLFLEAALFLLLVRIGISLRRTPARDLRREESAS